MARRKKKDDPGGCGTIIALLLIISLLMALKKIIGVLLILGALGAGIYGFIERDRFKQLQIGQQIGAIALILFCLVFGIYLVGPIRTSDVATPSTETQQETLQETQQKAAEQSSLDEAERPEKMQATLASPTTEGSVAEESVNEEKSAIDLIKATVTRVVDGDTIYVKLEDGTEEKVRMIGVDTPESTTQHEPYGEEASNFTKSSLTGKTVYLEKDVSERDKYNRLLRYVWLEKPESINETEIREKMFNAILVAEGYAQIATYAPDVKYADYFKKFQEEARTKEKGLWALEDNKESETVASTSSLSGNKNNAPSNKTSSSGTSTNTQSESKKEITVYVTATGEKYHRAGCRYLKKSKIPISLSEAKASGYEPCKVCNPPR